MSRNAQWIVAVAVLVALHVYVRSTQMEHVASPGESAAPIVSAIDEPASADIATVARENAITVIAFFETWCGPCKIELPVLEKAYQDNKGHGLGVIGVYGSSSRDTKQFASALGLTFPLVHDAEGRLGRAFGVEAVPVTVIVDRTLKVLHLSTGFDPGFADKLQELLQEARKNTDEGFK